MQSLLGASLRTLTYGFPRHGTATYVRTYVCMFVVAAAVLRGARPTYVLTSVRAYVMYVGAASAHAGDRSQQSGCQRRRSAACLARAWQYVLASRADAAGVAREQVAVMWIVWSMHKVRSCVSSVRASVCSALQSVSVSVSAGDGVGSSKAWPESEYKVSAEKHHIEARYREDLTKAGHQRERRDREREGERVRYARAYTRGRNCSRHRYRHADALQVLSCR